MASRHDSGTGIGAWPRGAAPLFQARDLAKLGYLAILTPLALGVPERFWQPICRFLARSSAALQPGRTAQSRQNIRRLLGSQPHRKRSDALIVALNANYHCERLQYLRSHRVGGWHPAVRLVGQERVEQALAAGRGAILWQQPFAFSCLLAKMAVYQAGFRVTHLSRFDHGISRSRMGARLLNWIWTAAEERYLEERLVMYPGGSVRALKEIARRVRQNQLVSITVGRQGQRFREVPFLHGKIRLAEGPAALAHKTGAALLPVFAVRQEDGTFLVTIESSIRAPAEVGREEAIGSMLHSFVAQLGSYVLRWPEQYQGWDAANEIAAAVETVEQLTRTPAA